MYSFKNRRNNVKMKQLNDLLNFFNGNINIVCLEKGLHPEKKEGLYIAIYGRVNTVYWSGNIFNFLSIFMKYI